MTRGRGREKSKRRDFCAESYVSLDQLKHKKLIIEMTDVDCWIAIYNSPQFDSIRFNSTRSVRWDGFGK